jgi:hypothetical protein
MMNNQLESALLEACNYASSRLFNEVGVSLESVPNLNQLCQTYQKERKICLFTGAGVSFTGAKYYQTPGWWDLLIEIYGVIYPELTGLSIISSFKKLQKKYSHPWRMASFLEKEAGRQRFTKILCQLLYNRITKKDLKLRPIGADEDKRLPISYLHHAATLNAVIAFSSSIRAIRTHACFVKNTKVHAVLTLNYDSFLEAGATQKYNAGCFKPRVSKEPPRKRWQLPVYHIHAYIPYGGQKPATELVLTKKSYQEAYKNGGRAREIIDEHLIKFSTLFIGISFDDELLLQRLEVLAKQDAAKNHFALIKQGMPNKLLKRLESTKILPILYSCHEQLPTILGHIYKLGLSPHNYIQVESMVDGKIRKVRDVQISKDHYWEVLLFNKA